VRNNEQSQRLQYRAGRFEARASYRHHLVMITTARTPVG
jgi:hypothetical protein